LAPVAGRTITLDESLANIGSEVSRAVRTHTGGNETAVDRALELFDLTVVDFLRRAPR